MNATTTAASRSMPRKPAETVQGKRCERCGSTERFQVVRRNGRKDGRCAPCVRRISKIVAEIKGHSFDHYLVPGAPEECWIWTGNRRPDGYGRFGNNLAHRLAWERANGPIPDGLFVCHRCDIPPCCNPNHLFLGTHDDNMHDMATKGRGRGGTARGEASGRARLKAEDIPVIRRLSSEGVSQRTIASAFGVSPLTIFDVIHRRNWRHIP